MFMKDFKEKLKLVPELPGSYQMKDKKWLYYLCR